MGRLTVDILEQAFQHTNPVRDRELDLRSYKIPVIENLGSTLDQFDCIDFTDNEIRKLDGFPLFKRLKWLLMSNNKIAKISPTLADNIPNLEWLILTNNAIAEFTDLEPLAKFKNLRFLSLLRNPIQSKKHYRLFVIHKLPQLMRLDFQRIKLKERKAAKKLFATLKEKAVVRKEKEFTAGEKLGKENGQKEKAKEKTGLTKQQRKQVEKAIKNTTNLGEIERLQAVLKTGVIPTGETLESLAIGGGGDAMETQ